MTGSPDDRVTRADWTDWYVGDDESAVMVGSDVVVVSMVATLILEATEHGATVSELAEHLVAAIGAPPDGDPVALTRQAVDELVARGVLRWSEHEQH